MKSVTKFKEAARFGGRKGQIYRPYRSSYKEEENDLFRAVLYHKVEHKIKQKYIYTGQLYYKVHGLIYMELIKVKLVY